MTHCEDVTGRSGLTASELLEYKTQKGVLFIIFPICTDSVKESRLHSKQQEVVSRIQGRHDEKVSMFTSLSSAGSHIAVTCYDFINTEVNTSPQPGHSF